jgi:hypothetical protein
MDLISEQNIFFGNKSMRLTTFLAVYQRHRGTTGTGTGTDRPGLFYDVFDKNFQNIIPFWAI